MEMIKSFLHHLLDNVPLNLMSCKQTYLDYQMWFIFGTSKFEWKLLSYKLETNENLFENETGHHKHITKKICRVFSLVAKDGKFHVPVL